MKKRYFKVVVRNDPSKFAILELLSKTKKRFRVVLNKSKLDKKYIIIKRHRDLWFSIPFPISEEEVFVEWL